MTFDLSFTLTDIPRYRLTHTARDNLLFSGNHGVRTVQGTLNPGSPLIVGSAYGQ